MAAEDETVKGGKEILLLAEKGLALFAAQEGAEAELDTDGATAFKAAHEAKIAAAEAEAAALTGKDNKKARQEKSKAASAMKTEAEYIDACKVVKGQQPKNGNFVKKAAEPAKAEKADAAPAEEDKKDDKKAGDKKPLKKTESAGISKAERDELDKLKNDIIARKKELKESGMSGGQMNKDEEVVTMVKRMNDLKEKENPGGIAAAKDDKKKGPKKKLSADQEQAKGALENEIEEYKGKLKAEFGYTNKEIKADPDLNEMLKKLAEMK